jgi:hypothetical protein
MLPPWRKHPRLERRFHPEFPDDIQVIVHDGGPRKSDRHPELVWVRVNAFQDGVFSGVVLNQPSQLRGVTEGSQILFIVPDGGEYPVQVSHKYLEERSTWCMLAPCRKCGLTELFDPISEIVAAAFPSAGAEELATGFTLSTRCGWCGDGLVVRVKRSKWPWSE